MKTTGEFGLVLRTLIFATLIGLPGILGACPLPATLQSFDSSIPAEALPDLGNEELSKLAARRLLAELEEFREIHLEGYRRALGSYGQYIIRADRQLERSRNQCKNEYDDLHLALKEALDRISGEYRDHYRGYFQQYKTRVRFAKSAIFFG